MIDTEKYKPLLYNIIGASREVRNTLGKGLLESIYQEALAIELAELGIPYVLEQEVPVFYKKRPLKKKFRLDMLVADDIVVELKSVAL